jgi:PIN domain nuclease of toxin-antitoxin system
LSSLLLDTHVLLWSLDDVSRLSPSALEAVGDGATEVFVSAASAWEISIKRAIGKLQAPADLRDAIREASFMDLDVTFAHASRAGGLPPHHSDPFDRMLVAQAQSEGLTLVSADERLAAYDVQILW